MSNLKVGSLVFATDQGLGYLAKAFYDHKVVTDVMCLRHGRRPDHDEWYPEAEWITNVRDGEQIEKAKRFCERMDVMLFFETPFMWELLPHCKSKGIKTVLMPMYECMPIVFPAEPDAIINPSALDQRYYPSGVHIPIPVEVPWKLRTKAEVFVHNAGNGGLRGRNGTLELMEAMEHVKSPIKLIVRTQTDLHVDTQDNRIFHYKGTLPYNKLYDEGDVFVFPEKFNGLSLPLQEARAAGMLIMCGDRFPMNDWLPNTPLIPVKFYQTSSVSARCNSFPEAVFDPKDIAEKIDEMYGKDITHYSHDGKMWAEENSWEVLRPRYLEELTR